jgi:hypothetical protein
VFTQKKATTTKAPKLYSIHALPDGGAFAGDIAVGKTNYSFRFHPKSAEVSGGKLILKGAVSIAPPRGQKRTAENVAATLLSTQGNILQSPLIPSGFPDSLKPPTPEPAKLPITDATDDGSSIGVMYLKLSPLDGRALGLAMDLSAVQLNARLYPQSQTERDLQWLYSSWLLANGKNEPLAAGSLAEINRILGG